MSKVSRILFVLLLGVAQAGIGCSSKSNPNQSNSASTDGAYQCFCKLPQACQDIAQACHSKDDGSPSTIHDCHITGHEVGTETACAPVHDNCLKVCNAAPPLSDSAVEDLGAVCRVSGCVDGEGLKRSTVTPFAPAAR